MCNDVKVTNEKFISAFYKLKIDSAENTRKRRRKHDNAQKSKKRKEEREANRTWDIVAMVMNEKANLEEVVELCENSVNGDGDGRDLEIFQSDRSETA